jgi:putative sigma-54 modulation protein
MNRFATTTKETLMEQLIEVVVRDAQDDMAETLRAYAIRRLSFALRRFEQRVRHVTVRLVDLNGPKRGVDSRCSMTVDFVDGRHIFVDATTAWPFASVTRAAGRLSEALRREFKRGSAHRLTSKTTSRHAR